MQTETTPAPMGHNNPPSEIEIIQDKLREKYPAQRAEIKGLGETVKDIPAILANDDDAGRVTDIIRDINGCNKKWETFRTAEKEPFLSGGRAVDAFFSRGSDILKNAKDVLSARLTNYQNAKAAEERRKRQEAEAMAAREAAERAAEALRLEQEGKQVEANHQLQAAVSAEQDAARAQTAAVAAPAKLTRAYGSATGATASLRTVWVGEVVDMEAIDLEKLRPFLGAEAIQKAINAFVKAEGRELKGAKIYQKSESVVR